MEYFETFFVGGYYVRVVKYPEGHFKISIIAKYGQKKHVYVARLGGLFGAGEFHRVKTNEYHLSAAFFPPKIQSLFSRIIPAIKEGFYHGE